MQQMSMLETISPQKMPTIEQSSTHKKAKGSKATTVEKQRQMSNVPEDPIEDSYDRLI